MNEPLFVPIELYSAKSEYETLKLSTPVAATKAYLPLGMDASKSVIFLLSDISKFYLFSIKYKVVVIVRINYNITDLDSFRINISTYI